MIRIKNEYEDAVEDMELLVEWTQSTPQQWLADEGLKDLKRFERDAAEAAESDVESDEGTAG